MRIYPANYYSYVKLTEHNSLRLVSLCAIKCSFWFSFLPLLLSLTSYLLPLLYTKQNRIYSITLFHNLLCFQLCHNNGGMLPSFSFICCLFPSVTHFCFLLLMHCRRRGGLGYQHLEIGIITMSLILHSTLIQSMTIVGSKKSTTTIDSMLLLQWPQTLFLIQERFVKIWSSCFILICGVIVYCDKYKFSLLWWSGQRKCAGETANEETEENVWWCSKTCGWRSL